MNMLWLFMTFELCSGFRADNAHFTFFNLCQQGDNYPSLSLVCQTFNQNHHRGMIENEYLVYALSQINVEENQHGHLKAHLPSFVDFLISNFKLSSLGIIFTSLKSKDCFQLLIESLLMIFFMLARY